jgi:hypothetical protein
LIISGPASTDDKLDDPACAKYALWAWDGTTAPVLKIPNLAPYTLYPTGVTTFTITGTTIERIAFSQKLASKATFTVHGIPSFQVAPASPNLVHWPISIVP